MKRSGPAVLIECAAIAACLCAFASSAAAQGEYPLRTVRIIVPSSPAGGNDTVSRLIAQGLTERWGRQVVVDNRPGASTMIGGELVARAAPDGYTLLMGGNSLAINPATFKKIPFDAQRDFAPITQVMLMPNLLVSHPSLPARDLRELIALTRARPGQLLYATAGHGSNPHLMMELYASMAKVRMLHVPYKGSAPGIVDLIAGHVALMAPNMLQVMPHVRSGRLRAYGVTSAARVSAAQDIPTIAEAGLPGYEDFTINALFAPAATPREILLRLHGEVAKAAGTPELRKRFPEQGIELVASNSPEDFTAYIKTEVARYAKLAREAGIKAE